MNLTIDPWIPVTRLDGTLSEVSLFDLFDSSEAIRDLAVKPHEKIAIMRLLICITQAALDGPENREEWEGCRNRIKSAVRRYLEQWKTSFELLGKEIRFLQVPDLQLLSDDGEGTASTKLDLALASGNNSTLFDNGSGLPRKVSPGRAALNLLSFQCFAPGGRIGIARWMGMETLGKGSSNHAPCTPAGMLHAYLLGSDLLETIHLNLLSKEEASDLGAERWGKPVWEFPVDSLKNQKAIANATLSYLGRLVPISRAVFLKEDELSVLLANGLEYPLYPAFREPASTIVQRSEDPGVLGASLGKSLWRQLSAITVHRIQGKDPISGPLAFGNMNQERACHLWMGALCTDKAKIEDLVESFFCIPANMFRDSGRKLYQSGIKLAEDWESVLMKALKVFSGAVNQEAAPYDRARHHYWTSIEGLVHILFKLVENPEAAGELEKSAWGRELESSAKKALDMSCPHQTPRQIQAYALACQRLTLPKSKSS
jgi:CRISPR system Cascade subunit CasA